MRWTREEMKELSEYKIKDKVNIQYITFVVKWTASS